MPRKNPLLYPVQVGSETITVHFRKVKRAAGADVVENLYFDFYYRGKRERGCADTSDLRLAEDVARKAVEKFVGQVSAPKGPGITLGEAVAAYLAALVRR